jgi:hypothetical protein
MAMSRRIFFVVLFAILYLGDLYLVGRSFSPLPASSTIWDLAPFVLSIFLGLESVLLVYWAWVDDDRLYELERKAQDIPLSNDQNPEA